MTTLSSTSTSKPALAPLQPPNLYHLSPTYNKWCALRCADLVTLRDRELYFEGKLIHHYLNHPIRYIKLLGLVVSIDDFARRRVYTIDDSSGACIECVALLPLLPGGPSKDSNASSNPSTSTSHLPSTHQTPDPEPSIEHPKIPWTSISECTIVRVLGVIGTYMSMPQIQIIKVAVVGNTEVERKWWDECASLKREVLGREWRVSEEEVARWERREKRRRQRERERGRGREKGREGEKKIQEGDKEQERRREREREKIREIDKNKPERGDEGKDHVTSNRKAPVNAKDKDLHNLLEIATHPSTSTSTSLPRPPKSSHSHPPNHPHHKTSPNKSTSTCTTKSRTKAPIKKRIIPIALPDLAEYDTFGL